MNKVVASMNEVLRTAVAKAGPQVHFIDYDSYVGLTDGRYCQSGQDESGGAGANREDLFFYEMKSQDTPWLDQLERRDNSLNNDGDIEPFNGTLGALYGALVQEAIDDAGGFVVIEDDNVNPELDLEVVVEELAEVFSSKRAIRAISNSTKSNGTFVQSATSADPQTTRNNASAAIPGGTSLGAKVLLTGVGNSRFTAANTNGSMITNGTSSTGTVIANSTHVLVANKEVVSKNSIRQLFVSDLTARVFHPTQAGHALIANLILYQMTVDLTRANGESSCLVCHDTRANRSLQA